MNSHFNPVLVLAAGDQTRWNIMEHENIPEIKQLCEVRGETLIERIERQFPDCIVFTNNKELAKHCKRDYPVSDNFTTISSLSSTCVHWRGWATILLGDVMYSRAMVRRLARQKESLLFYGDDAEIYALKFNKFMNQTILNTIQSLIGHDKWERKYGKLWNLYRHINGINFTEHLIGPRFVQVNDCRDFDTKEEYLNFIK